ncbi:Methylated-DNA--[protein]-cysteine S-methyltransferase [Lentibacillus sp. JNUCC-1]|uniref:methylated-DNA--[protein]-cysteine S-methyltransferase n=1 Tax=Lentibacillus sp. JNUCC-1 TaxID=2654513 RepID=UPI0012E7B7E3|nr:methylated-DNA--[protein]-cysteine S-methyltransferase [Lentibacillus sp. JNUCC-1]MUV36662.1 Methylated-DNA--[protein]-cysteine S-methyltransferase [Lentibacillus sp. JNUCC-1]
MKLLYKETRTPLGPITIAGSDTHVVRIDYGPYSDLKPVWDSWSSRQIGSTDFLPNSNNAIDLAAAELGDYFEGKLFNFSFPFYYYGTDFQKKVWQALYMTLPYGGTRSYKDIAEIINKPKAVRAVGGAVNKNPLSIVVPCHRVVGKKGGLVGYNGGLDKKEFLLKHEQEQLDRVSLHRS